MNFFIRSSDLNSNNIEANKSSIQYLASKVDFSFDRLLRGDSSFGGLLEQNGFSAVPSPNNPQPDGNTYYRYVNTLSVARSSAHIVVPSLEKVHTNDGSRRSMSVMLEL